MESSLLSFFLPLSVAFMTGAFTYYTALSQKENDIKLKKYESLGIAIFSFMEKEFFVLQTLQWHLKITSSSLTTSSKYINQKYEEYRNFYRSDENPRSISVQLAFASPKQKKLFDDYLKRTTKKMEEIIASSSNLNAPLPEAKEYTAEELTLVLRDITSCTEDNLKTKTTIINGLSRSYHSKLNTSRTVMLVSMFLVALCIIPILNLKEKTNKTAICNRENVTVLEK